MSLTLFCYVRRQGMSGAFEVEIRREATIVALKDAIKEKKKTTFRDFDASSLILWNSPIKYGRNINIEEEIKRLNLTEDMQLDPFQGDALSEILELPEKSVHIIVDLPTVVSPESFFRLVCYVRGDGNNIFEVEIRQRDYVAALKDAVKKEMAMTFRNYEASSLILWNVSIPFDQNTDINEEVEKHNLVNTRPLKSSQKLAKIFSSPLDENLLHILVEPPQYVPNEFSAKTPEELAHEKAVEMADTAFAPSLVSKNPKLFKTEQEKNPIYIGLPGDRRGPPITIYHEAFAQLKDALRDVTKIVDEKEEQRVDDIAKLFLAATEIYETEQERVDAMIPHLDHALGIKAKFRPFGKAFEPDAAVNEPILDETYGSMAGIIGYHEFKNVFGGADGIVQDALTLRKHLAHPKLDVVRNACCCPCIIVSVAGPYVSFHGAIFAEAFVVEPFTDPIFLGGNPFSQERIITTSQIFAAVSQAFLKLRQFYRYLKLKPTLARLFPQPTYIADRKPEKELKITARFDFKGRKSDDFRRSLFRATYGGEEVLVKFCDRYHGDSHRMVAEAGQAPQLFFCEHLQGGVIMVIMKFIDGLDAHYRFKSEKLPEHILKDVKSAIQVLHDVGLVFGDIRRPNILIEEQNGHEHALLIDFEWVGLEGQERYPALLNDSGAIDWAMGMAPHAIMRREHDLTMIKNLDILT